MLGPEPMKPLTERQEAILEFIASFLERRKIPPAVREIQRHFRFESPNAVTEHLVQLEKKGYLRRRPGLARGIEIVSRKICFHPGVMSVPFVGEIAAGSPLLAEENIEGYLHLDKTLISATGPSGPAAPFGERGEGHFLLKVKGESMKGAGIWDKDFVLVKKQESVNPGEIIAAYLNGEATVKRYVKKPGRTELRPENPAYSTIRITSAKYPDFRILGKVCAVLRLL